MKTLQRRLIEEWVSCVDTRYKHLRRYLAEEYLKSHCGWMFEDGAA